ncbi:MerR family transcriptional regulator [Saccharothrix australiensis]|uniref:MerR-like DNA binding protein n=1 Tax=Saccharothrix australiensis TaxID=2072 RepID=A0A495W4F4_9PSEU|nr:MerR family transcriptional regulator [Saccharothrix australiensis]RKT56546.1 MerR-like DNA binding protein [Saccharothrix australiensis]
MTAAGRPQRGGLSIGAVLAQLRSDFPDVTISKIRFLESEGLVRPARTASGYRQFTAADVERLRFVLAAQRDRYLPLKVIKEHLDAVDAGGSARALRAVDGVAAGGAAAVGASALGAAADGVAVDGAVVDGAAVAGGASAVGGVAAGGVRAGVGGVSPMRQVVEPPAGQSSFPAGLFADQCAARFAAPAGSRISREELLARSGLDPSVLAEVERAGLIRAGVYDQDAVQVALTVRAMTERGLEPRHLRAFRAAADRVVGLVDQVVPHRAGADEVAREVAALSVTLHTLLVKTGLRDVAGGRVSPR